MTPIGTTGGNVDKWALGFEDTTYQKMVWTPTIDTGDRPLNLLHVRKKARVAGQTLGQSATGEGLTYVSPLGTPITVTPVGSTVPVAWSENEDAQLPDNLDQEFMGDVEQSLAELTETTGLANIPSFTQSISQAVVDAPMFRSALARLIGNTNGLVMPGENSNIYAIFSHTQYPALMNIPEFTSAYVRGDNENPHVKGIWGKGNGVKLLITTVITVDGNGWHNCMYIPSAFIVAWNVHSRIKRQDLELNNRLIAYNNVGFAIKHDLRGIDMRTQQTSIS
jgi:hypothetical protein